METSHLPAGVMFVICNSPRRWHFWILCPCILLWWACTIPTYLSPGDALRYTDAHNGSSTPINFLQQKSDFFQTDWLNNSFNLDVFGTPRPSIKYMLLLHLVLIPHITLSIFMLQVYIRKVWVLFRYGWWFSLLSVELHSRYCAKKTIKQVRLSSHIRQDMIYQLSMDVYNGQYLFNKWERRTISVRVNNYRKLLSIRHTIASQLIHFK